MVARRQLLFAMKPVDAMEKLVKKLTEYAVTGKAEKPYEPNWEAAPAAKPESPEPPGGWQGAAHGAQGAGQGCESGGPR